MVIDEKSGLYPKYFTRSISSDRCNHINIITRGIEHRKESRQSLRRGHGLVQGDLVLPRCIWLRMEEKEADRDCKGYMKTGQI